MPLIGLLAKCTRFLRSWHQNDRARDFICHNQRIFTASGDERRGDGIVLMELNDMASSHIAYSYLSNVLADVSHSRIWAYYPRTLDGRLQSFFFKLRARLRRGVFGIYSSFGVSKFIAIHPSQAQRDRAESLLEGLLPQLVSKEALENVQIDGVWIGDLIYDTYLRRFHRPTVDLRCPEFIGFLRESVELFVYWHDFFRNHDVRGINVSHCVYNLAMPLRIAIQNAVPAFQSSATHIYRLNKDNYFAYNDFHCFPQRFAKLPAEVQERGLKEAKQRIDRRFAGEVGVDMSYSTKSAYGAARHKRLLATSSRKKILIATHCFFDSPHSYGKNVFPDFYEWLSFLGSISEQTDYDWYIKTHPDYLPGTKQIIDDFIRRFPRFSLLPSDASHLQIVGEGIDFALTVYGTIGFEYAALGIPVINNSPNNPHVAYGFNLHAKSVHEYRQLLMGLNNLNFTINKKDVLQYYFMRYIFNTNNLFFDDYDAVIKELGGYREQFQPPIYTQWLIAWSPEKHELIRSGLKNFIESQDFRMDYTHLGREFALAQKEDAA